MAINVSQAFHRTSANPVDDTLTLTKAQMLAVNDNLMPSKYLTICQDDGFIYLYDKSATPNVETGKFTKFEGGHGHEILDGTGTALTQRDAMQFNEPFIAEDNGTDEQTELGLNCMDSSDMDDVVTPLPSRQPSEVKYSTTEQIIGKWIDNRPYYETTLIVNNVTISSDSRSWIVLDDTFAESHNIDAATLQIVSQFAIKNESTTPEHLQLPMADYYNGAGNGILAVFFSSHLTNKPFRLLSHNGTAFSGMNVKFVIRYAKTTD